MHGGSAPQVRAKAAERLATQAARADANRALAHDPGPKLDDPLEALGQVATEAIGLKDALAARVNALNEMRYSAPGAGTEQLRAEVAAYERALDRVARIADLLAKHDFRGRQLELEQERAQLVTAAFRAAAAAVGDRLLPADRDLMIRVFLRGLGADVPEPTDGQTSAAVVVRGEVE